MNRFKDKIAVVTGGSSGIGATVAMRLAAEGARVHVVASSSIDKARVVADRIVAADGQAAPHVADVQSEWMMRALADNVVKADGRIDIWVNAAGVFLPSPVGDTPPEVLNGMIDINLKGSWNAIQAVVPHMKAAGGGKILNFSSVAGLTAIKGFALYCASKAATAMLTRVLGAELAPFNINVNAIAPGNTETPMNDAMRNDPAQSAVLAAMKAMTPSNQTFSKPDEIASTALFLVSDEARPMYGSILLADEGLSAAIG
ncbi:MULTISPECIES: SDR family NAD(P)-dependent oxidoreductase [Paracoccus]|jgi:3-oxoacyl-[acyl-carrier protein] reductase|uniref:Short-chain dehydrogenase/reductase SDR n=1 Tax=Paracoccus denitrificans (strain Pd 1222) TaxID=318586 RepID=A1AZ97_PARDP|nr:MULTISPECIES: SDR family oxidoreductase [Paracoccus]ABL68591.1 short-chain dehydrogenase/reductase SDR [Paracoccus denitrificans PD1222]MBB4625684.1 3-oxoacyl-[acyl-carrier protein] reductase [Paracoccus denitrificans]MCU7427148.1 SDR family oxidoreductase [Paracoccus denitrificans]QAR26654.1 SDR family oxidoreductase [Paracoccus denitrificans]QFQ89108.1 SDR family oxidoreductase [Paracoccus kondratievae]